MVNDNDQRPTGLEQRSKALFDESVGHLNGSIRSRLTQARHRAVAEAAASRGQLSRRMWIPAAGLAAAVLTAVIVVMPSLRSERRSLDSFAAADDVALLLNAEDFELLEDMEFYAWLDSDPDALRDAPPTTAPDVRS